MATMIAVRCKVCGSDFDAKVADRRRGWALCCSKSCAAIHRESKMRNDNKKITKNNHYYDFDY